ncbi:MAG: glycosyl hydrolase [Nocardioides sp.]
MPLTRRGFLAATGAATAAVGTTGVISGLRIPATAATSAQLAAAYGVVVHPSWAKDPMYGQTDRWMAMLAELGVKQIRGLVVPHQAQSRRTAQLCRRYGIKWLMPVVPAWRLSPAEATARVNQIAAEYADVVLALEGVNEPNNTGVSDWAQRTIAIQRAIWDARNANPELADIRVLSPALHDRNEIENGGAGYRALAAKGIDKLCDRVSLHSYPRGGEVTTGLADRLKMVDTAYADMPVWITETGWTTYTGGSGQKVTTTDNAAKYGAEAISTIADHPRVRKAFRYELLDDPGTGSNPESRYGLVNADWSRKPEFYSVRKVLTGR